MKCVELKDTVWFWFGFSLQTLVCHSAVLGCVAPLPLRGCPGLRHLCDIAAWQCATQTIQINRHWSFLKIYFVRQRVAGFTDLLWRWVGDPGRSFCCSVTGCILSSLQLPCKNWPLGADWSRAIGLGRGLCFPS